MEKYSETLIPKLLAAHWQCDMVNILKHMKGVSLTTKRK